MKRILTCTLLLFIISFEGFAQNIDGFRCAKRLLNDSLLKHTFQKYNGEILLLDKNTNRYGERIIQVMYSDSIMVSIFERGILYPELIVGNTAIKTKSEFDSLSQNEKMIYNFIRSDSVRITNLRMLDITDKPVISKLFTFLLWRKSEANPSLYFFELMDEHANEKTDLNSFILGSKLTLFEFCSILI